MCDTILNLHSYTREFEILLSLTTRAPIKFKITHYEHRIVVRTVVWTQTCEIYFYVSTIPYEHYNTRIYRACTTVYLCNNFFPNNFLNHY